MAKGKLFWAKAAVLGAAIPVILWAYEYGPDVGYCGVPNENGTCATSGCHTGTANSFSGSVTVTFPNGMTYTPGVTQQLTVTISDPATTQRAWGFQLTARQSSSTSTQEGAFASADANTQVLCSNSTLDANREKVLAFGGSQTCGSTQTLSYMEHTLAGYDTSRGKTGSYSYNFTWTPPSTNVGNITIYVAGNAANGDLTSNGDHIYTKNYVLTPAATGPAPAITSVVTTSSQAAQIAQNAWLEIHGANLAQTTTTWDSLPASAFSTGLPTSLGNVSATVNGKSAAIYYISPIQVNILAPLDSATGSVSVQLNNNGQTASQSVTEVQTSPAFLVIDTAGHVAARHLDYSLLGPTSLNSPGYTFTPAKGGELVLLYATGFGQTSPAIDNQLTGLGPLPTLPAVTIGGVPATVAFAGLSAAGLYQFNVTVPAGLPSGDATLSASYNGSSTQSKVVIAVQ